MAVLSLIFSVWALLRVVNCWRFLLKFIMKEWNCRLVTIYSNKSGHFLQICVCVKIPVFIFLFSSQLCFSFFFLVWIFIMFSIYLTCIYRVDRVYNINRLYKYPMFVWDLLPHAGASQVHPHLHGFVDTARYQGKTI